MKFLGQIDIITATEILHTHPTTPQSVRKFLGMLLTQFQEKQIKNRLIFDSTNMFLGQIDPEHDIKVR